MNRRSALLDFFPSASRSADEKPAACRAGEFSHKIRRAISRGRLCLRENFKCRCEKGIAGENGHAFPEDFVRGRLPAPQIVVIHAGQIVMNERVGVNAFDSARRRQRILRPADPAGPRGREAEHWPHSLPACKQAVAHRPVNRGRLGRFFREPLVQHAVDRPHRIGNKGIKIHQERRYLQECRSFLQALSPSPDPKTAYFFSGFSNKILYAP